MTRWEIRYETNSYASIKGINANDALILNPFRFEEYTAQHIVDAQFLAACQRRAFVAGHQAEVRARVNVFLHKYATSSR